MGYRQHTVKRGECISSIAFQYGFFPDSIWDDPRNSDLKELRGNPNVLLEKDIVYIRDLEQKTITGASDARHRFRRKGIPEYLRIRYVDSEGRPCAGVPYRCDIDGGIREGTTSGDGLLEEAISPAAVKAIVTFPDTGEEYSYLLKRLDPIETISGLRARLNLMGFFCNPDARDQDEELIRVLLRFQSSHSLAESGESDGATQAKLVELVGC